MLKNLVNIAILTTIVIGVWVFVSIYNSFTSNTISTNVAKQIDPITPNFDTNAISSLQERTFIPTDLSETIATPSGLLTEEEAVQPTPTVLTQPAEQQIQSSESGVLNQIP